MNQKSTRIYPHPDVAFRQIEEEIVLLNLKTGQYFSLDEVGARIWSHLMETHTLEATIETMLEEYQVEPEQLYEDITEFIAQLQSHGLINFKDDENSN